MSVRNVLSTRVTFGLILSAFAVAALAAIWSLSLTTGAALAAPGDEEVYGIVDSFPAGLLGDWIIDGVTYTADSDTEFKEEHGPFFVGGCVEVGFDPATLVAEEIETAEAEECGDDAEHRLTGIVGAVPPGFIGIWEIGGESFEATAATEIHEGDGPLVVGACAQVEFLIIDGVNVATEIESEDAYHCHGGDYTNEVYGHIDAFPADLFGTWVVDGLSYLAEVGVTEFEEEDGPFEIGACVKVKYFTDGGVNRATEIETEDGDDCNGDDDGDHPPAPSKLYATIDALPPEPYVGEWTIGGATLSATTDTEFEEENGAFAVGVCVEAKYEPTDTGIVLVEVETEEANECEEDGQPRFEAYGVIEALPADPDLLGDWIVSGLTFTVNTDTELNEEHGLFAVGAFVEIYYLSDGGALVAHEIETHVAPGAGRTTRTGHLNAHSGGDRSDWIIDGRTYHADPAINVAGGARAPQVGATVFYNAYEVNGISFLTLTALGDSGHIPFLVRP